MGRVKELWEAQREETLRRRVKQLMGERNLSQDEATEIAYDEQTERDEKGGD